MLNQLIRMAFVALALGVAESLRRQLVQARRPTALPPTSTEESWEGEGGAVVERGAGPER